MAHVVQEGRRFKKTDVEGNITYSQEYNRILHSEDSEAKLQRNGFEPLFSSNVSAAAVRGKDLIIRFHNGSVYSYAGQGKNYLQLIAAASHGKWVWRFLRRPNKPYKKIGSLPLPEDIDRDDEQIFKPRPAKYKVESILPSDDEIMQGVLPSIMISPIEQAQAIMGVGGLGAISTMMLATNQFGIIGASIAANIIKGT